MQLFAKHPTGLEVQHTLISSAVGEKNQFTEKLHVQTTATLTSLQQEREVSGGNDRERGKSGACAELH